MSVLDFVEQAKQFTPEERTEIISAIQQQLFEARQSTLTAQIPPGTFEIWSPSADEDTIKMIQRRVEQRQ